MTVRLHGQTGISTDDGRWVPSLGGWTDEDADRQGSRVRTSLVWDPDAQVYRTLWWNAVTLLR